MEIPRISGDEAKEIFLSGRPFKSGTVIHGPIRFHGETVEKTLDFREVILKGGIDIYETELKESLWFSHAQVTPLPSDLSTEIRISDSIIGGSISFDYSNINAQITLHHTEVQKGISCGGVIIGGSEPFVNFGSSVLLDKVFAGGPVSFSDAMFDSSFSVVRCNIPYGLYLADASVEESMSLLETNVGYALDLSFARHPKRIYVGVENAADVHLAAPTTPLVVVRRDTRMNKEVDDIINNLFR